LRHEPGFEEPLDPASRSAARAWIAFAWERVRSRLAGRTRMVSIAMVGAVGCASVALWALPAQPEAQPPRFMSEPSGVSLATLLPAPGPPQPVNTDSIAAAVAVLRTRSACVAGPPSCLESVDDGSSALFQEDRERLASGVPLRLAELPAEPPTVVSEMGDAVLLRFEGATQPASVLMIRTEAGWRVRDVFD
ncbi:MAG: hypothetical protein ACKOXM_02390, partial [Agromyces sp.]